MAGKKKDVELNLEHEETTDEIGESTYVELNLEKKVTVKNIAGWTTSFKRLNDLGDVMIVAEGSARLSRNEIISQVQIGNTLFSGIDGAGSHATLFINDSATRIELGFDDADGKYKQTIFNDKDIAEIFKLKNQKDFETKLTEAIKTRAEKYALMQAIKRLGINDYSKIRFCENYTGYKYI